MPVTIVVAALAAGSIVLIALGIALSGSGGVTLERLERYAAGAKPEAGSAGSGGVAELIQKSAALAQFNKVVERRDFGANLLRDLGAADLKLKPSEFLGIWAGLTIGHQKSTAVPKKVRCSMSCSTGYRRAASYATG